MLRRSHSSASSGFQQGRTQQALGLIAAAIDAKQDYPEALYNRGNILAALGRYHQALSS